MSASKALTVNATLTSTVTDACLQAMKAGMTKDETLELLNRIVAILEASDDE